MLEICKIMVSFGWLVAFALLLSLFVPRHWYTKASTPSASHNSESKAIAAIEGALRIKDLWLPPDGFGVEEEAVALNKMYRAFLEVTQ